MARPGVTFQDIATAANTLKILNKNITIENIRSHLGTGSIGTINKYLRLWREEEATTSKLASKENLPEELTSLMQLLWEGVLNQSLQHFQPIEENYQQEIAELKRELEKYKTNNRRWQNLFNRWLHEKANNEAEKASLEQALALSQQENACLKGSYDGLLQQLQEKQERVEELNRLHKQSQMNLEHYRESVRVQRLSDKQHFELERKELHTEIKSINKQLLAEQAKQKEIFHQHQMLNQTYLMLENQYQTLLKEEEKLKNKIDFLKKKNVELQYPRKKGELLL